MADDKERTVAHEIELGHPDWMVLWGCYSRLFWAFPRFDVPRGTIVSAPISGTLVTDMQHVEVEFMRGPDAPGYSTPGPAAQLPRRAPLAQREARRQQDVPAAVVSPADTWRQQDADSVRSVPDPGEQLPDDDMDPWPTRVPWPPSSYDPYSAGPVDPGGGEFQWADSRDDEVDSFAPDGKTGY